MPNPALLTYAIASNPSPIQTSSPQSPLNANINIGAISPTGQSIYCSEIDVAVPVGSDATSLTPQGEDITGSLNTTTWNVFSNVPARRASLNIPANEFLVSFTCKDPSDYLINYNLVLGLAAQVNGAVGDCTIKVFETSGTSLSNLTSKDPVLIKVSKESPNFYLQNLVATAVGSPTIPATEFPSGTAFTLSWESNGTFFQVYQKGNPTPIYAGTQTTFTIPNGVPTDTTFFLVAMMTSNPSGDNPPSSYVPIYLYDALTITISNPTLNPASVAAAGSITGGSLNISGLATLSGQTNIGTLNSPDTFVVNVGADFKTTLEVEGNLWVTQGTTILGGQTNIGILNSPDTLVVNVGADFKNTLEVEGNLWVTQGTSTLNGPANVNGFASLFGGAQICDGNPNVSVNPPAFLLARGNSLFLGYLPPVDDAPIHFKISDGSGLLGYSGSSRTIKEDIQDFSDDFHKILKAQPVSFKFKGNEDSRRSIGYIAEDFHDLGLHHLLSYNEKNEPMVIKYDRLALYQLEIIKELLREVESLKEKVNAGLKPETEKKASGA